MTPHASADIRASFLEFFRSQGHEVCPSASLVPQNDPTLLFVNAGMVPFKDVFTGKDRRSFSRATSSQKVIRISGKHNDLENVGVTARHHTFFEMLGNFSFGDYFKEEAIRWAWELVTKVWQIPQERLVVTVFGGAEGIAPDDEARHLWRRITGFDDRRILGIVGVPGDNFWQMGETGPCGPCTEIHYYTGDGEPRLDTFGQEPTPDGKGWMELWNLVFMQFDRSHVDGAYRLEPLPRPCVDTGAGLERVASVLQGKTSNYETDLLRHLVDKAAAISGKTYGGTQGDDDVSMRVIADHARLTAFLIAEGIFPDRAGRPYVLRRVMRRAIRHGHRLGIEQPFLHKITLEVVATMGETYPDLHARRDLIASIAEGEEVRFRETIDRGLKILEEDVARVRSRGEAILPGDVVFKLYDTYGFPVDLTEVIVRERGMAIDVDAYERAMEEQRARSGDAKLDEAVADVWRKARQAVRDAQSGDEHAAVRFTGYERESDEGTVLFLASGASSPDTAADRVAQGSRVAFVTDTTPLYGESGGQVGDTGIATTADARVRIDDTQRPLPGLVVHLGVVLDGEIRVGDRVTLVVDQARRTATRRNHSATHLLHWALRTVVGETAVQKGSLVGPDRLRFDYAGAQPLTGEQLRKIEDLVNDKILGNAPVHTEVLPIAEAKKRGAMAIFEEKYGDVVRVLTMTSDSVELCGGTHARALGEIGLFKIVSESGIAAGVRRIEAATGSQSLAYVRRLEDAMRSLGRLVKAGPSDVVERVEKLLEETKKLERELSDAKRSMAMGTGGNVVDDLAITARTFAFGKALAANVDTGDAALLRELAEKLRDKLGHAVVLVGSSAGGKVTLVLTVTKSLTDRFRAGDLIRPIAAIVGGSGGGRPDMAQAGGPETARLGEALEHLYTLLG